jgi:hypothetical protein
MAWWGQRSKKGRRKIQILGVHVKTSVSFPHNQMLFLPEADISPTHGEMMRVTTAYLGPVAVTRTLTALKFPDMSLEIEKKKNMCQIGYYKSKLVKETYYNARANAKHTLNHKALSVGVLPPQPSVDDCKAGVGLFRQCICQLNGARVA